MRFDSERSTLGERTTVSTAHANKKPSSSRHQGSDSTANAVDKCSLVWIQGKRPSLENQLGVHPRSMMGLQSRHSCHLTKLVILKTHLSEQPCKRCTLLDSEQMSSGRGSNRGTWPVVAIQRLLPCVSFTIGSSPLTGSFLCRSSCDAIQRLPLEELSRITRPLEWRARKIL